MPKEITLNNGMKTKVDDDVFEWAHKFKWNALTGGMGMIYASRHHRGKVELLHRLITCAPRGMVVDHINHDTLDNQIQNLRVCSQSENLMNRKISKNSTTGYSGVHIDSVRKKFGADIGVKGKRIFLGRFTTLEDAVKARLKAEREYFKEFAFRAD